MIQSSKSTDETTQAVLANLRRSHRLCGENIQNLTVCRLHVGQTAEVRHILVDYGSNLQPRTVVTKTPVAGGLPHGEREILIYRELPPRFPQAPIVEAIEADYDDETGNFWLVLKDVSETHAVVPHGMPPMPHQIRQAASALATLHAIFWEHELLATANWAHLPSPFELRRPISHAECYFDHLLTALDGRLPSSDGQVFELVFERLTGWLIRRFSQGNVTLTHGDAHASNFLFSIDASTAYIIDWQSPPWIWRSGLGVGDVAYFMVRYWHNTLTETMAPVMLREYFECLLRHDVRGFSWEQLMDDFRASCLLNLCTVIEESVRTTPNKWYPQMVNLLAVIRHFECCQILEGN